MILVIGEILIDIFPDYERIGGAPFNFACHMKRLGFPVRFFTRVGDDTYGERIFERLKTTGFDRADVQLDPLHPTGTVQVALNANGVPRFQICENVAYDHLDLSGIVAHRAGDIALVYFGSLLQRTDGGRRQVQTLLSAMDEPVFGFCDINMRPPHVNAQAVDESLHQADLLKLNEDELAAIRTTYGAPTSDADGLLWLMETFGIGTVALTRGDRGSRVLQGEIDVDLPADSPSRIVDTVGAGDAFAAVLAAGLLRRHPLHEIVHLATRFSARICNIAGAVPDDLRLYDDLQPLMEEDPDVR